MIERCGMLCMGGSEKKLCPCVGPAACEYLDDPLYPELRQEAKERMFRHFRNEFPDAHPAVLKLVKG